MGVSNTSRQHLLSTTMATTATTATTAAMTMTIIPTTAGRVVTTNSRKPTVHKALQHPRPHPHPRPRPRPRPPQHRSRRVHFASTALSSEAESPVEASIRETPRYCTTSETRATLFWTRDEREDILESNRQLAWAFRRQHPESVDQANQVFDQCCRLLMTTSSSSTSSASSASSDFSSCSSSQAGVLEPLSDDSSDDGDDDDYDDVAIRAIRMSMSINISCCEEEGEHHDATAAAIAAAAAATAKEQSEAEECFVATRSIEVPTQVRGLEWGFLPAAKQYRRTHVQRVLRWQAALEQQRRPVTAATAIATATATQTSTSTSTSNAQFLSTRAVQSSRPSRALARILGASDAVSAKGLPTPTSVVRRSRCRMLPTWW